jgi:hypothetical protein
MLLEEKILMFTGKVNDKDGVPKFLVDSLKEFPAELNSGGQQQVPTPAAATSVTIKIPASVSEEIFVELKKIFEEYPGELEVNLMIDQQKVKTPFRVDVYRRIPLQSGGAFWSSCQSSIIGL